MSLYYEFVGPEGWGTYEVEWGLEPQFRRVYKPADAYLIPGLVDIHIHGGWGIDFMNASTDDLHTWADALTREGYEGFLPTTVAASAEAVLAAVEKIPDDPRFLGFHLEGPFLSEKFPGAQPKSAIRNPEPLMPEWDPVLNHPRLRVVTLAPELPNVLELITRLRTRGVIVSMGHSNATFEEAKRGFEFGAAHVTHTFNAMRPFHHREAGILGYALTSGSLNRELIYDRLHVSKEAAHLLLNCAPNSVIGISDATAAVGLPPGTKLQMWGLECEVEHQSVHLANTTTLAGSGITLLDGLRNMTEDFGFDVAFQACCVNPRRALGVGAPKSYFELDKKTMKVVSHRFEGRIKHLQD